jgi:pyruvate kinase
VLALREAIDREAAKEQKRIDAALPRHRPSARNLAHYLGLRRRDMRRLQVELASIGLSSLGRSEGHVRDTVLRLCGWLSEEMREGKAAGQVEGEPLDQANAEALLRENTRALFGRRPADRHVYIMVTAPAAAEATETWADSLLAAGIDVLRINAAHESPAEWAHVVSVFKARAAASGHPGRVFVDLPGPKLRAEIRQKEERILHLPRHKDRLGRTTGPTELMLVAQHESGMQIPVPGSWLARMRGGDMVVMTDAGGRGRELRIRGQGAGGVLADCDRSLYVRSGLRLAWKRGKRTLGRGIVGRLPRVPRALGFVPGDEFVLNGSGKSDRRGTKALCFPQAQLLAQVHTGERVVLDDGRIVAVVESASPGALRCRVQRTVKLPTRLRSGKGVAFPDSALSLGELATQDEAALAFALAQADGASVSFVNSARDVALVGERISKAGRPGFGMILKLETRGAMRNLPGILFEALRYDPVGLMIARGDLAVELSFERLAEMQEELLWLGEACHLPVIWATQVLDSVAQTGLPTRAEVTDAAMAMRAECVMLNKGPHIAAAVRMLADIIRKMETHQYKKRSLLRPLEVAESSS